MDGSPSLLHRADRFFAILTARLPPPLNDPRVRFRLQAGTAIALAVGLFVYLLLFSGLLAPLNRLATDFLYHPADVHPDIAIIAIDQKSLDEIGDGPWSRSVYADLITRLQTAPRLIAFDIVFDPAAPGDDRLAAEMKRNGHVIAAATGAQAQTLPGESDTFPNLGLVILPVTPIRQAVHQIGHRMITPDVDGIVRRIPTAVEANHIRYPALGLAAAQDALGISAIQYDLPAHMVKLGNVRIPVDEQGDALLNFTSPGQGIPTFSFVDVLYGRIPASAFENKIVFIGETSILEAEDYAIPLNLGEAHTHNVNLQADLTNMILSQPPQTLKAQGALGQLALTLAIALLAGLTLPHLRPLISVAITLVYLLGLLLFSYEVFNRGVIIQILYPALALIVTAGCITAFRYLFEERRRQFLTSLFRRYVPAESVGRVVAAIDSGELPLSGTRRMVTVLYLDLRGFATLSDEMTATTVLDTVNRYIELALQAIQAEGGTVSKPMGDTLIAIWNAPLDQPDHAARALRAAIQIRRNITRFQQTRVDEQTLNFGIGLATGWAVLGNISAFGKVEYTLVGDTVNVAARISAFANNNQILSDSVTAHEPPPEVIVRELSPVRVRGRKDPLPVWEVRDEEPIGEGEVEEEE